jgi:acid phosphatase type 7
MTVSWNTYSPVHKPVVYYYSTEDKKIKKSAHGTSNTYPTSKTFNHHVLLTGLKPATKYRYTVGKDSKGHRGVASGKWYEFTTARPAGDDEPYSIAVVVDLGLMGSRGLSTTVGKGAANPLAPGDLDTIQSLEQHLDCFDFLWHREGLASSRDHPGMYFSDILNRQQLEISPTQTIVNFPSCFSRLRPDRELCID